MIKSALFNGISVPECWATRYFCGTKSHYEKIKMNKTCWDAAVYCESFPTLHELIQVLHVPGAQQQAACHTPPPAGAPPAALLHLHLGIHPHPDRC